MRLPLDLVKGFRGRSRLVNLTGIVFSRGGWGILAVFFRKRFISKLKTHFCTLSALAGVAIILFSWGAGSSGVGYWALDPKVQGSNPWGTGRWGLAAPPSPWLWTLEAGGPSRLRSPYIPQKFKARPMHMKYMLGLNTHKTKKNIFLG